MFTSLDPDTQRYYANGWRLVKDSPLAKMRVSEITNDNVVVVKIEGSGSNVNNARRTVHRLLNLAVKTGAISKCPSLEMQEENSHDLLLDDTAETAILPHSPQPLRDIIVLMRDMGTRNSRELYPMRMPELWE